MEAKVICDSISESGKRITTLQVKFHRFILPEFNTHRVFSRNFSSSRAIPTQKLLDQVRNDPAMPIYWGKNQPGMQAREELTPYIANGAKFQWKHAALQAAFAAESLSELKVHKQIVNRLIEPFMWAHGVVTSTEWDNFFDLRCHIDAQPEIRALAYAIRSAMDNSTPILLQEGKWHLPYISEDEKHNDFFKIEANKFMLQKISSARCCRVSYLKHDGSSPNIDDDLALYARLANQIPIHASPMEHQATPSIVESHYGNFRGWAQFRKYIEFNLQ
jgi:hypothetical protein